MGRPPVTGTTRDHWLKFRTTAQEAERIAARATRHGVTRSEWMRRAVLFAWQAMPRQWKPGDPLPWEQPTPPPVPRPGGRDPLNDIA